MHQLPADRFLSMIAEATAIPIGMAVVSTYGVSHTLGNYQSYSVGAPSEVVPGKT